MSATELVLAREYIHAPSVGNSEESSALYLVIEAFLLTKYSEEVIDGYNLLLLPNAEQCKEELVDDDWKTIVTELYPILYVFVQPNSNGDAVFDSFLKAEGFIRVK